MDNWSLMGLVKGSWAFQEDNSALILCWWIHPRFSEAEGSLESAPAQSEHREWGWVQNKSEIINLCLSFTMGMEPAWE